jgi:AcrR family transcriptional regulator
MPKPRQALQANTFRVKTDRKRKLAPAGNVRLALLDATGQIIREQGIGFVSLREVARRAKVSHAAPAHYFRNKSGLFTAFAAQGFELMAKSVMESVSRAGAVDGPASLEAVGAGYVRFAVGNPEHFTIMFRPASTLDMEDPDLLVAREAAYGVLTNILQRCAREGFLDGIDTELAMISAWSIVHGLAALWLSGRLRERVGERDAERLGHKVAKLFVDAVLRKKLKPRKS